MEMFVIDFVLATKDKQSGLNNLKMTPHFKWKQYYLPLSLIYLNSMKALYTICEIYFKAIYYTDY